jgi:hypothetical protein
VLESGVVTERVREKVRGVGGISRRTATWPAWSLSAFSLALTAASVLLLALNLSHPSTHIYDFWLENTVLPLSFSIIGAIIASRHPPRLALLRSSLRFCGDAP